MIKEKDPILNYKVVAIHRKTGKVQFAEVSAPSREDAEDFVQSLKPQWIVIKEKKA
jgi:hypothetical protein